MKLDIVIPVYNEGPNIRSVLESFRRELRVPYRVLICYDFEGDTTLTVLEPLSREEYHFELVRNPGRGVREAIRAGIQRTTAPFVITFPADDDYNAPRIDAMMEKAIAGCDIVCASRLMRDGCMVGCYWLKAFLVRTAAFLLYHIGRLPTHDPTNGLRLFSRRVIEQIPNESQVGWAFSLEWLVKCHRLGWPITELPAEWHERKAGKSRFRILGWLPQYLKWFFYGFATTWLRRSPKTVSLRNAAAFSGTNA
jgi:glycosyltransferase involved in cell wall biosynthesis